MAKKAEDSSLKKKLVSKRRNAITECEHLNGACTCTNLNGPGCKNKQSNGNCLKKAA